MRQGAIEGRSSRRLVILFIIISLGLLLVGPRIQPVASALSPLFTPVQSIISGVADDIGTAISTLRTLPRLRNELNAYKQQNAKLLQELVQYQLTKRENAKLRLMLNFHRDNSALDLQPARIIDWSPFELTKTIGINVGSDDGIRRFMPVLSPEGFLVGHIEQVWRRRSTVMLLTDPMSNAVGAMDLATHTVGVIETPFGGTPRLDYVFTGQKLMVGDLVVTSGLDSRYPIGLLIGWITHVHRSPVATTQYADIHTAANFTDLEYVQVVRNFDPNRSTTIPASILPNGGNG
jgi:rod shape-determining protein MreC